MNRTAATFAAVLTSLASACGGGMPAKEPPGAGAVDGVWVAELRLDEARPPVPDPRAVVHGRLALLANPDLAPAEELGGRATHTGTFALRLRPFGVDVPGAERAPVLVAELAGDSVRLVLQPQAAAPLRMWGVLRGDSISGAWASTPFRGGGASGRFVLRRQPAVGIKR